MGFMATRVLGVSYMHCCHLEALFYLLCYMHVRLCAVPVEAAHVQGRWAGDMKK